MKHFSLIPVIHYRELPPEVVDEYISALVDNSAIVIYIDWRDKDQCYLLKDWLKRTYKLSETYSKILIEI